MGFLRNEMVRGGEGLFKNNKLCQLLNIKYPVLQGGMAWIATSGTSCCGFQAGGLGIIGAGHMPPDALREEIVN